MGEGLKRVLKTYGRIKVTAKGQTVVHVWDYANNVPREEKEMTREEFNASEKAKWKQIKNNIK